MTIWLNKKEAFPEKKKEEKKEEVTKPSTTAITVVNKQSAKKPIFETSGVKTIREKIYDKLSEAEWDFVATVGSYHGISKVNHEFGDKYVRFEGRVRQTKIINGDNQMVHAKLLGIIK